MTWYETFYARVDAMDIAGIEALCTFDTALRFANLPEVRGRAAVREALGHAWEPLAGLSHEFVQVLESDDHAIVEAIVHYTLRDGRTVAIPSATAIDRRDGLVAAQRIHIDMGPLLATLQGTP